MTREEAINKVRQMSLPKETMEILEALAPELAESEDERVRKKMIEHFRSKTKETWCNIPVKDIIAYLEKQKEQKPVEWSEKDELMISHICSLIQHISKTEDCREIAWLKSLPERFNLQPKQEWSEEEIIYWNTIKDYFFGIPFDDKLKSALDWFKSLKPSWKPSEQDIKMLEHIIGQYEIGNKNSKIMGYLPRIEELDFLKKVLAKWKN